MVSLKEKIVIAVIAPFVFISISVLFAYRYYLRNKQKKERDCANCAAGKP